VTQAAALAEHYKKLSEVSNKVSPDLASNLVRIDEVLHHIDSSVFWDHFMPLVSLLHQTLQTSVNLTSASHKRSKSRA